MKKASHTYTTLAHVAEIVKTNLSGWYLLLALLFFAVFMTSCDAGKEEEQKELNLASCKLEVTAVKITCGYGAFEDTWLQLPDGTYLQPWENMTGVKEIVPDRKYRVDFSPMPRDNRYDELVRCMAALPEAEVVNITCLEPVSGTVN
ncbi:MAG TPA: hypothetical protein VIG72_14410 [Pontibacter sp.]